MSDRPPPDFSDIWHDDPVGPPPAASAVRPRKPAGRRPGAAPRRRRGLSVLGYAGIGFACLCAAAAAFLVVAAPFDLMRDRLVEEVKARTGRDLVVAGGTSLTLFPRLAVSLGEVALSAPEGTAGPPALTADRVDVELGLRSLIGRQGPVERVVLHRPTIELSVDANGRWSWEALTDGQPRSAPLSDRRGRDEGREPRMATPPDRQTRIARTLSRLGLTGVRIVDGTVRYRGASGEAFEIQSLDSMLTAEGPGEPLKLEGSVSVRGVPLSFAGKVSSQDALLSGRPAQLAVKISGPRVEGAYEGTVTLPPAPLLDGKLKLSAPSLRALAEWLGRPLPSKGDADTATLSATIKAGQERVALSDIDAGVGDTRISGILDFDTSGPRRRLSGYLQVSELDVGRLLLRPGRSRGDPAPPTGDAVQASGDKGDKGHDWSDDPINVSLLGVGDADLGISAGRLVYKDLKTGPSRLLLSLDKGVAKVALDEFELYGGRGQGVLTLDASSEVLATGAHLQLRDVALRPLLTDALGFTWLEGRGTIALSLAGQGGSERQIVEGLNGKAEMTGTDGAIVGLDVGKVLRSLQSARLPNLTPSAGERTPFSELAATFIITNGVAANENMKLVGTHLQLNGEGRLDLGPRHIDYTVRTRIGGTPEPGAPIKVGSIEVPISIVGPWEKPSLGIKGQEHLAGALKRIRKSLRSQDVKDAIQDLLEGDGGKRGKKARDLIDKLLKKD
jgi:AsmA protein